MAQQSKQNDYSKSIQESQNISIKRPLNKKMYTTIMDFKRDQMRLLQDQKKKKLEGIGGIRHSNNFLEDMNILIVGDSFVRLFTDDSPINYMIIKYPGSPTNGLTRLFTPILQKQTDVHDVIGQNIIKELTFFKKKKPTKFDPSRKTRIFLNYNDLPIRTDVDILRQLNRNMNIRKIVFNFGNVDCHSTYFFKAYQMRNEFKSSQDIHEFNKIFIQETIKKYVRFINIILMNFPNISNVYIITPLYSPVIDRDVKTSLKRFPFRNFNNKDKKKLMDTNFGFKQGIWNILKSRINRNQIVDLFNTTLQTIFQGNPKIKIINANSMIWDTTKMNVKDEYTPVHNISNPMGDFHIIDHNNILKDYYISQFN
jgi:hypothetical protein